MMNRMGPLLVLFVMGACVSTPSLSAPTLSSATAPVATVSGRPELRLTLRAPTRAPYDVGALGPTGQFVTIRVENVGPHTVRVSPFQATFSVTREGVTFLCDVSATDTPVAREPASLAPGQSFVFERPLDCMMALPGTYDVAVAVRLGDDGSNDVRATPAGSFRLEIGASPRAPKAVPSRPGLFAVMTGGTTTRPMSSDAWARGDYHVVVAVINGSQHPIAVGSGRLSFLVYRKGSPLPCSGQAELIVFPEEILPGTRHVVHAPIACAPSSEGKYEIVGHLSLGESGESFEVGRLDLRVTSDPKQFTPLPWSFGERGPGSGLK
jgi:hypothetical protein